MKRINQYILSISFIIFALLLVIDFLCFFKPFYSYEYQDLNTHDVVKMSKEDLDKTTDVLLDYIKGNIDSLDLQLNIDGKTQEVFNVKEKTHMLDVRNLYLNAMHIKDILFLIIIAMILIELIKKNDYSNLFKVYRKTLSFALAVIIGLALLAIIDFDLFWTSFHKLIFSNDLWLLNPNTDRLINLVPSQFFNHLVLLIIISYILLLTAMYFILKNLKGRKR